MNFDPQTYEELIRMKRCVELTKYYELTEEELEEIYRFLEQNPEASVKGGRQNLALIRGQDTRNAQVIIANCILVLNGSLRSFDISYLLTKGGPGNSSELMSTYMYKQAFTSMKYGYGSAVAMVIVAICLIVGFLFRRFTERGGEE